MHDFSYFMFFVVYVCFPYLVYVPELHAFDYRYNLGSLDYSFKFSKENTENNFNYKKYDKKNGPVILNSPDVKDNTVFMT